MDSVIDRDIEAQLNINKKKGTHDILLSRMEKAKVSYSMTKKRR